MKRYEHSEFTVASWFGKGESQIKVQKIRGQALYQLTYKGEKHVISAYDWQTMREEASNYKNREAFFKSTYWKTDAGIIRQHQQADNNFKAAIQRMEDIPREMQGYALKLWENLDESIKERFWDLNSKLVDDVFRYYNGTRYSNQVGLADEPERTNADDIEALQHLINKLETYYTPEQLSAMRESAVQSELNMFY